MIGQPLVTLRQDDAHLAVDGSDMLSLNGGAAPSASSSSTAVDGYSGVKGHGMNLQLPDLERCASLAVSSCCKMSTDANKIDVIGATASATVALSGTDPSLACVLDAGVTKRQAIALCRYVVFCLFLLILFYLIPIGVVKVLLATKE